MTVTINGSTGITTSGITDTTGTDALNNATVAGTLAVTGASTMSSTLAVTGAITGSSTIAAATGTLYPLVSGTSQASTSGTSIDFTGIPSWVKRITVMFSNVSTNGTSLVQIQVGSGSFSTSSYSSGGSTFTTGVTTSTSGTGILVGNGSSASNQRCGTIVLTLLASNGWTAAGAGSFSDGTGTWVTGGITPSLSGALDRVRITTVNGTDTFDAGSINILYE